MKARVKATGEIADVMFVGNDCIGRAMFKTTSRDFYNEDELDFDDIRCDSYWEELTHQYAGMAMQGLLAGKEQDFLTSQELVEDAIIYAAALVKKLKGE